MIRVADLLCGHSGGGQFAMGYPGRSRPEQLDRLAESLTRHGTAIRKVVVLGVGHDAAGTRPPIVEFFAGLLADNTSPTAAGQG